MIKTLGVLLIFAGTCSVVPLRADDFAPVKCGTNQDRVWVYDSLTSFNVQAQIRCGENVQIVARAKGYVKVRIKDGSEGYVADSSLPSLLPLEDHASKPADSSVSASTDSLGAIARRLATSSGSAPTPHLADASSAAPKPADSRKPATTIAASIPSPSLPASVPATPRPASITNAAIVNAPAPEKLATKPMVASAPAPPAAIAAAPAVSASLSNAAVPPANVPAAPPVAKSPSIAKPVNTAASVAAPHSAPSREAAPTAVSTVSAVSPASKPATSAASRPVAAKPNASTNVSQPPAVIANPNPPASIPAPALPKPAPPVVNTEMAANIPAASPVRATPGLRNVSATADSEDFTDFQPVSESADPACQTYFSAYGLAPSQIKWIAQNRKKEFPSICPAPDPSKVDFVVIFTHDDGVYSSALPAPVHTDRNGFSDFSAMVGVDTAALSNSDADKAHRQFVWVFTMRRGAFDPASFSARRRYQFTKVESSSAGSKASVKSIEDAFEFAMQQSPGR
jgi:hypothetical protein